MANRYQYIVRVNDHVHPPFPLRGYPFDDFDEAREARDAVKLEHPGWAVWISMDVVKPPSTGNHFPVEPPDPATVAVQEGRAHVDSEGRIRWREFL